MDIPWSCPSGPCSKKRKSFDQGRGRIVPDDGGLFLPVCPATSLGWAPPARVHELAEHVQEPEDPLGVLSMMLPFASVFSFFYYYSFSFSFVVFTSSPFPHLIKIKLSFKELEGEGTERVDGCAQHRRLVQAAASSCGRKSPNHEPSVMPRAARLGARAGPTFLLTPLLSWKEERKAMAHFQRLHHDNSLRWVCLTGDTCHTSSSTSHL